MRIQLEFPESKVHELKTLMAEADIETYKELFNPTLTATRTFEPVSQKRPD